MVNGGRGTVTVSGSPGFDPAGWIRPSHERGRRVGTSLGSSGVERTTQIGLRQSLHIDHPIGVLVGCLRRFDGQAPLLLPDEPFAAFAALTGKRL